MAAVRKVIYRARRPRQTIWGTPRPGQITPTEQLEAADTTTVKRASWVDESRFRAVSRGHNCRSVDRHHRRSASCPE